MLIDSVVWQTSRYQVLVLQPKLLNQNRRYTNLSQCQEEQNHWQPDSRRCHDPTLKMAAQGRTSVWELQYNTELSPIARWKASITKLEVSWNWWLNYAVLKRFFSRSFSRKAIPLSRSALLCGILLNGTCLDSSRPYWSSRTSSEPFERLDFLGISVGRLPGDLHDREGGQEQQIRSKTCVTDPLSECEVQYPKTRSIEG